ncbi:MAG: phage major capsid protein [Thermomicrobiales bacterium]
MATNQSITRDDVSPPEDMIPELFQMAIQASTVLQMGRRLQDMLRNQQRIRVLDVLPAAYWVSGDSGLKQTSRMAWKDKFINAEELAVIVPVPENVLDDNDYDIWEEVKPRIGEEFGRAIDAAILFGDDAPTGFPSDIVTGATAALHAIAEGSGGGDVFDDIFGPSGSVAMVEADGYAVTGHIEAVQMRAKWRGLRTSDGSLIFSRSVQEGGGYTLDGNPAFFPLNGSFDPGMALDICGDWNQLVWSLRSDMDFKVGTEAVIQDNAGNIVFNTFQQDMVALRCTLRMGWQLPNPVSKLQADEALRYPFAILTPAA